MPIYMEDIAINRKEQHMVQHCLHELFMILTNHQHFFRTTLNNVFL